MTAKEMFEELGYKQVGAHIMIGEKIRYKKDYDNVIVFYEFKEFMKRGEDSESYSNFTLEELQAINKQVKELQWDE